jgi:uncharacterized membrane protein
MIFFCTFQCDRCHFSLLLYFRYCCHRSDIRSFYLLPSSSLGITTESIITLIFLHLYSLYLEQQLIENFYFLSLLFSYKLYLFVFYSSLLEIVPTLRYTSSELIATISIVTIQSTLIPAGLVKKFDLEKAEYEDKIRKFKHW